MSANKSFSTETSERYSRALFEISKETAELGKVENDIKNFQLLIAYHYFTLDSRKFSCHKRASRITRMAPSAYFTFQFFIKQVDTSWMRTSSGPVHMLAGAAVDAGYQKPDLRPETLDVKHVIYIYILQLIKNI